MYNGDDFASLTPRPRFFHNLRWFFFPILFTIFAWSLHFHTEDTLNRVPALWANDTAKIIGKNVVTPVPESRADAFRLGRLYEQLMGAGAGGGGGGGRDLILKNASGILGLGKRV
jgi:hypothetical protein